MASMYNASPASSQRTLGLNSLSTPMASSAAASWADAECFLIMHAQISPSFRRFLLPSFNKNLPRIKLQSMWHASSLSSIPDSQPCWTQVSSGGLARASCLPFMASEPFKSYKYNRAVGKNCKLLLMLCCARPIDSHIAIGRYIYLLPQIFLTVPVSATKCWLPGATKIAF